MRFLCLHGRGTNSKIFEMQTAAIRYELADHHTYDFVEGTIPWEVAPEMKEFLTSEGDSTFTFFKDLDSDSALEAIDHLTSFIDAEGPYDAVIAYSQTVGMVGTWMAHQIRQGRPTFRCAVFLSAATPVVDYDALKEGYLVSLPPDKVGELINIPTAHVWGSNDPWAKNAEEMVRLCNTDVKSTVVFDGGHEVPGTGTKDALIEAIKVIRRAVILAQ